MCFSDGYPFLDEGGSQESFVMIALYADSSTDSKGAGRYFLLMLRFCGRIESQLIETSQA